MKTILFFIVAAAAYSGVFAAKTNDVDTAMTTLAKEIAALTRLRAEKLDRIEARESERWNARYRHNEEMKLRESKMRQYDAHYSSLAGKLNRKQEDILLLKNALDDEKEKREAAESQYRGFVLQVRQAVEETAENLAYDFPERIAERTATLSSIAETLQKDNGNIASPLSSYLDFRIDRVVLTREQELITKAALFGNGSERTVWRLRFGTVFMVDVAKDSSAYQILMHNGALQGQRFMWKSSVGESFYKEAMQLVSAVQEGKAASVPLDVLQNGKIGVSGDLAEGATVTAQFKQWFSQGGLIMYPLFACALLALLLSLERFITLTARHHRYLRSYKNILPLVNKKDWDGASQYCTRRGTGLARAIREIIKRRGGSRAQAEQHVKQILLSEVPSLEKRMSLISALGSSAPLLGLLGTVSGMITLFKVITETGTNDARILAGGISEALVTTQTGLMVAIPILLIHGYLSERLDDVLSHYNETVLEVFNIVFNGDSNNSELK